MIPAYLEHAIRQQVRREYWSREVALLATRRQYARAWKAWKKANEIRRALAALTGNRNGPAKAWADECRVMLARAERAHRRALTGV